MSHRAAPSSQIAIRRVRIATAAAVLLLTALPGIAHAAETCGGVDATIVGTDAADLIIGTRGPDVIVGLGGDDDIQGMAGDDLVCGGDGDDVINGGHGSDTLWGDGGADRVLGSRGADVVFGGDGNDVLRGNVGPDVLDGGDGDDRLNGGEGRDRLDGGPGNDRLDDDRGASVMVGGPGADRLKGGNGADDLAGDDGDDEIFGLGGPDTIDGGAGNDVISGGSGKDTCVAGEDVTECELEPPVEQCTAATFPAVAACLDDPRASDPSAPFAVLITADLTLDLGQQIVLSDKHNLILEAAPGVTVAETPERMNSGASYDRQYLKIMGGSEIEINGLTLRDASPNDLPTLCRAGTHPTKPQGWTAGPCYPPLMIDGAVDVVIDGLDITSHKAVLVDLREVDRLTIRGSTIAEATVFGALFQSAFPHTDVTLVGNTFAGTGSNALVLANASGVTIRDNVFRDNHRDMQFTTCDGGCTGGQIFIADHPGAQVSDLTITGNTIATSPNPAVPSAAGIEIGNAKTASLGPIVITDNDITGHSRPGISLHRGSGGHDVTITANRLADNALALWEGASIASQINVAGSPGVDVHDNELTESGAAPVVGSFGTTAPSCSVPPGDAGCEVEVQWDIAGTPAGADPVLMVAGVEVAAGPSGLHRVELAAGDLVSVEILLTPSDSYPLAILGVSAAG